MRAITLLVLLAQLLATGQERIAFTGTVVDSRNGAPLAGVRVAIAEMAAKDVDLAVVTTGADGKFSFSMPPADYILWAERAGSLRQAYGAVDYGGIGVGLMRRPGVNPAPVTFRLIPPAVISGRVRRADGSPAENARVQLLRATVVRGRRETVALRTFFADDRGEFRFPHLVAGTYYLVVDGRPWHEAARVDRSVHTVYTRAYFPNTPSPDGAAPIAVRAGDEFNADLTVTETPTIPTPIQLTGTVPQRVSYVILAQSTGAVRIPVDNGTIYNGKLEGQPLTPGSYEVSLIGTKDGRSYLGAATLELGRSGQPASIAMATAAIVTGEVRCDGKPGAGEGQTILVLSHAKRAHPAIVTGDGRVRFDAVPPGQYEVDAYGSRSCYFSHVLAGGKAPPGGLLAVGTEDIANLTFEMRGDGAKLRGYVTRGEQKVAGARLILLPANAAGNDFVYPRYLSDSDGSFSFPNMKPGEYRLLSLPSFEVALSDAKTMAPLLEKAVRVTLPPNGDVQADLPLAPEP